MPCVETHGEAQEIVSRQDIEEKWRKALAEGPVDRLGENPDYPERVVVRIEDFVMNFEETAEGSAVRRETQHQKDALTDEGAQALLDTAVAPGSSSSKLTAGFVAKQLPMPPALGADLDCADGTSKGDDDKKDKDPHKQIDVSWFSVQLLGFRMRPLLISG